MRPIPRQAAAGSARSGDKWPSTPSTTTITAGTNSDDAKPHKVSTRQAPPQPATRAASGAARPAETSRPMPMKASVTTNTLAHPARSAQLGISNSIARQEIDEARARLSRAAGIVKAGGVRRDGKQRKAGRGKYREQRLGVADIERAAADENEMIESGERPTFLRIER